MLGTRALTPAEIQKLRSSFTAVASLPVAKRMSAMFSLSLACGLRESEAISVSIGDIYQHEVFSGYLYLQRSKVKGKKAGARLPINDECRLDIEEWVAYAKLDLSKEHWPLFPATLSSSCPAPRWDYQRHIQRNAYQKKFFHAVKHAGLTGKVTTHCARKTYGMAVYKATGNNPLAAKMALRHSDLASTMHYLSIGEDEVFEAIMNLSFEQSGRRD